MQPIQGFRSRDRDWDGSMEFIGAGIHHRIVYGTSSPSLKSTEMQNVGLDLPGMSLGLYLGGKKNFPSI